MTLVTVLTRWPPLLVGVLMLHTAVSPQLRVLGVAPDLLLLLGIAAGIAAGPQRGAVVGFVAGLLADCFLQTPFGLSALCYSLVGYGVGIFQTTILHAALWIPVATAVASSAVGVALFAVVGAVLGEEGLLGGRLPTVVVVVALLNGLLVLAALRPVRWATAADVTSGLVLR
ncbi:MAG: rod shape-determining protein MreD [Actinomycetota bacterium]|nr:rod shape-determining protein MreD [Actinomycetota bacterium]